MAESDPRTADTSKLSRAIWQVKVPECVDRAWGLAADGEVLGELWLPKTSLKSSSLKE